MAETTRLALPFLEAAQAQKHVTVNEALVRLDGLVNPVLVSRSLGVPPVVVAEGACYGVPLGAVNAWAGHEGEIAIASNGGWVFAAPQAGWRVWIADEGQGAVHSGADWVAGALTLSPFGAGLIARVIEADHVIAAGASSTTAALIPAGGMVIGVSARVVAEITGTLSSWQLGNAGAPDRFGSGLGLGLGSWARGMLSAPMTFWAPETLVLTAMGGDFAAGTVRIAVHVVEITLPSV
ncbi:DUF2793 domain-containing protein [Phaeovulum vinaykumarii]|uniref:DUF2793 domain-containing protein n=1 Tax=Phaeovulum vinaykumarii TaxID=407234 RepID=A0A1N7JK07_9RHOB|nr:DUF2793 domain-containing protein [Phaeovulum vinaykumarii]SIS49702.1 Protein of unknown function [Phaeovulum vinaykumarii]SOB89852.1 uncharacterized protein DUF2793 [Phaeovulum vinaykumarii]